MAIRSGPQFGTVSPEVVYTERPGVYALAIRTSSILVLETPVGLFLPGGGIEGDETPEDALRREVREETGFEVVDLERRAVAWQYVIDRDTGMGFNKAETFFTVHIVDARVPSIDRDVEHHAPWVPITAAIAGLREDAQSWAVWILTQGTTAG